MKKRTPEEIIYILHSIKKVQLDQVAAVLVWQNEDDVNNPDHGAYATSFEYDSFTRKLLELIEDELVEGELDKDLEKK